MTARVLERVEPALLWERFLELTRIARPSKAEGPAREHVLEWARARDLPSRVDAEGNVVVVVPPTAGRDAAPAVVLQSHLDMVCERDPSSPYDPRDGRIDVRVDDDWVRAEGTTLGADNGVGVAAALAVAESRLPHGQLELLFTVSEEQGLDGARMLDASLVSGRLLVNLDGTSDNGFTVGCAGSDHTFLKLPLAPGPLPPDRVALRVELSGARGGHSGEDVVKGRANAIKCLGRVLSAAYADAAFELSAISGGVSRNAIPRDAHALVAVPAERVDAFGAAAAAAMEGLLRRYAGTDDGLGLSIDEAEPVEAADLETSLRALDLVAAIPTGVLAMSTSLPGVVETSTSLTVASTDEDGVLTLSCMARSSSPPALDELLAVTEALARLAGAGTDVRRSYPPWEPGLDSPLLDTAKRTYHRLFDAEPVLTVVHGGLECAVLGEKLPAVQMVSIGPEVVGPHAPGEKLSISSTQRFYRLLGALLDDLSR